MRNLKRVLSLAIASVMLLGMMVVGTSAANYPDVDAQDNLEAIEVLKAVGIMTGDENGNFNPDAKVTRNEMAVVMVNLLGLKAGGTSPFTDVPAWAQPYVNACYTNGVTSGISATQYGGSNTVTAVEAALMVMKPLGYFGYQGEFGDDWKVATIARATKIDLFGDLDLYTDEALTRNDVAQLVLNSLESNVAVVTEQGGMSVEGNGITVNQKPTYSVAYAADKAGHDYDGVDDGILQLTEKLFASKLKKNADSVDAFNRPANEWNYKTDSIITPKAAKVTYTTDVKEKVVYADLALKADTATVTVYLNGNDTADVTNAQIQKNDSTNNFHNTGKGTVTEIYMNSDRTVNYVVQYQYFLVKASTDYDADDNELVIAPVSNIALDDAVLDGDDFDIDGYKKDDYIFITATDADNNGSYTVKSVQPATVVSDVTVSEYKVNDYVVAGGTKYNYSAVALADANTSDVDNSYTLVDTAYDLILDPYGYVYDKENHAGASDLSDYLFVKDVASNGFSTIAKVLFMDGTSKTVTVSKIDADDSVVPGDVTTAKYYTFKVDKNGEYELKTVTKQYATSVALDKGIVYPMGGSVYVATSDTKYIAKSTVYTGVKNAPKTDAAQTYALYDDNNYLLMVYTAGAGKAVTNAKDLIYVISTDVASGEENDVAYYSYTVIMDGQKTTLKTNESSIANKGLYEIESYTDGYADLGSKLVDGDKDNTILFKTAIYSQAALKNNVLTLVTGYSYALADDVQVMTIDGTTVKTIGTGSILNSIKNGFVDVTMIKVSDKDDSIATIYLSKP